MNANSPVNEFHFFHGFPSWFGIALLLLVVALVAGLRRRRRTRSWGLLLALVAIAGLFIFKMRSSHENQAVLSQREAISRWQAERAAAEHATATRQLANRMDQGTHRIDLEEPAPRAPEPDEEPIRAAPSVHLPPGPSPGAPVPDAPLPSAPANTVMRPGDAADSASPPNWIYSRGQQLGGSYDIVVTSTATNVDHCWNDIRNWRIQQAVQDYCARFVTARGYWIDRVPLDLQQQLIADQYVAQVAPQPVTLYVRLAFTPEIRTRLEEMAANFRVESRLYFTVVSAFIVVALVGVVFGYLKIDAATAGRHTLKLQVLSGVLVVCLTFSGVLAVAVFLENEWRYAPLSDTPGSVRSY